MRWHLDFDLDDEEGTRTHAVQLSDDYAEAKRLCEKAQRQWHTEETVRVVVGEVDPLELFSVPSEEIRDIKLAYLDLDLDLDLEP